MVLVYIYYGPRFSSQLILNLERERRGEERARAR
jgi:hypothetical protein